MQNDNTRHDLAELRRLLASARRWLIWLGVVAALQVAAGCLTLLSVLETTTAP